MIQEESYGTKNNDKFKSEPKVSIGWSRNRAAVNIRDSKQTSDAWQIRGFETSESNNRLDSYRSDNSYSSRTNNPMQHRYDNSKQ